MNSDNFNVQANLEDSPYTIASHLGTGLLEAFQRVADAQKKTFPKLRTRRAANLTGLDTIKIGFNIELLEPQLAGWIEKKESVVSEIGDKPLSKVYARRDVTETGCVVCSTYIPIDYHGQVVNLILIEVKSLPKLLGICNHSQIPDSEASWNAINEILQGVLFLVNLPDIRDGIVYRVDLSANFQVGQNVPYFLSVLQQRYFAHRNTQTIAGKQVIFSAHDISVSFYHKHRLCKKLKRCNHEDAAGILRMELQICTKRQAQRWLGSNAPTLRMITMQKVVARLAHDLYRLKLDKPILGNLIERISLLMDLSRTKIKNLIAYVTLRDSRSRAELKEFYSIRAISDHEKRLSQVGLSGQTTTELKDTLPSLLHLLLAGNNFEKGSLHIKY